MDEARTPIEDAAVNWITPYTTVARLMLPQQQTGSEAGRALAHRMGATAFDPWNALADPRPLGEVQRARRAVYFESRKGNGGVAG